MRPNNVITAPTHLLTVIVLGGVVFTLLIGQFYTASADGDDLALPSHLSLNAGGLVNTLRAVQAHNTGQTGRQRSRTLGNGRGRELETH